MTKGTNLLVGAVVLVAFVFGYGIFASSETPGERFRKAMQVREQECAKNKIQANDTSCDILKLQPPEPRATPQGRHAYSINVPGGPLQDVYRRGMTSQEYFAALCERHAGEIVLKTINGVDGILQLRPRAATTDYELQHLYAIEDPFGSVTEGDYESSKHHFIRPSRYRYLERISHSNNGTNVVTRITGLSPKEAGDSYDRLSELMAASSMARYGYTWRELDVPNGRQHGIAGSELIVLNTAENEVIAVRRGFIRTGNARGSFTGIWWMGGSICPQGEGRPEYYTYDFVTRVLRPPQTILGERNAK